MDATKDVPATTLDERLPCYREVEIRGATPGADYGITFLVPVYGSRK